MLTQRILGNPSMNSNILRSSNDSEKSMLTLLTCSLLRDPPNRKSKPDEDTNVRLKGLRLKQGGAVMNGIRSLRTSSVCSLTDIRISISVLPWFSLDLYYTSYPCFATLDLFATPYQSSPPLYQKILECQGGGYLHLSSAQCSALSPQRSVLTSQPSTVQSHSR
jgi:hypothetical protein